GRAKNSQIPKVGHGGSRLSRVQVARHCHPDDTTVTGHAAFPYGNGAPKRKAAGKVDKQVRPVEDTIAKAAPDHDSDKKIGDEVTDLLFIEWAVSRLDDAKYGPVADGKPGQIGQGVPPNPKISGNGKK